MDIKDNKKSETKQTLFLVLGIFLVSMFIIGGTYAYMTLSIDINNNTIAYNTACFDIVYDADNDSTPITGTLIPSSGPGGGLNGKISMGLSANCINIDAYGTFNLDVTSGSDILFQTVDAHCENSQTLRTLTKYTDSASCGASASGKWVTGGTALKYAIYTTNDITSTTVPLVAGYIKKNGLIPIYENFSVLNETVDYYFYIWLDGNLTDNTYASQSFTGGVSASVTQAAAVSLKPNAPVPDNGMIPVTIANDGTVTTVSSSDSSWYNYDNKEWANAVLVKESGTQTRSYYKSNTGVTIPEDDILAYYVWIPRYKYRIPEKKCSEFDNISLESNPECYSTPYIMSDTDKSNVISWWQEYYASNKDENFTIEQATSDINGMLQTGELMVDTSLSVPISAFIDVYNNQTDSSATYSGTLNGNNSISGPRTIDILFESKDSNISLGDAVNSYYTHPAFVWDGNTISGIWVGKFEFAHSTISPSDYSQNYLACTDGNCVNADGLIIKPNVVAYTGDDVSSKFFASLSMTKTNNSFGLVESLTDSHMMKNSEWGAVAYLSHSQYGINGEVRHNGSFDGVTGCGAISDDMADGCKIVYGSGVSSYPQSTSGNITGIFDMSGGSDEVVMGNYGNLVGYSGFLSMPDSKYYDLYLSSQFSGDTYSNIGFCTLESCGGHLLYETAGWYNDWKEFVDSEYSWLYRGGGYAVNGDGVTGVNGIFAFDSAYGGRFGTVSWRSVLVVD